MFMSIHDACFVAKGALIATNGDDNAEGEEEPEKKRV